MVDTWSGGVAELPGELPSPLSVREPAPVSARAEVGIAVITVAVLAALGAGVGAFWAAVSPHVAVVISADGPGVQPGGGEEFFAGEGVFALIGIAIGLLTGFAVWYTARRWRGPLVLAAVFAGSLAGALVAWQVGRHLGLAHYQELLRSSDVGRAFTKPVDVRSKGLLLFQPTVATAVYLFLAGWTGRPDLRPRASG